MAADRHSTLFFGAALIVVASAIDLPRLLIEIFDLPVPRFGGNPPYLMFPLLVLTAGYLSLRGIRKLGDAIEAIDIVFVCAISVCALAEMFHWASGKEPSFRMVTESLWWFLTYYAVRQHIAAGGSLEQLVRVAIGFIVTIGAVHFAAFGFASLGTASNAQLFPEIFGRNGISLLLAGGVFLEWFVLRSEGWQSRWRGSLLVILAITHAIANEARSALVAMLVLAVARVFWNSDWLRKLGLSVLAVGLGIGVMTVSFGYPVLAEYGWLPAPEVVLRDGAASDAERSTVYRLAANSYVVQLFADSPAVGVGATDAMRERAEGYATHTYYLLLLAAYGLVGVVAYGTTISLLLFMHGDHRRSKAAVLAMFLVTVFTFINDLWAWLALLAGIVTCRHGNAGPTATQTAWSGRQGM